jgi:sulfite reductase (NADPH) hemoprotein beta-component
MYTYDAFDQAVVDQRAARFAEQTQRHLDGQLGADEFKPLRLQNGLYIQKHAPMLRIAIPYGVLSSQQLHVLADIATQFDAGYGHFTTRQNLQLNGPKLEEVPAILAKLATVQMHAIQTSGNVVRNVTVDHFAGVAPDEAVDPRPLAELIRQWSTDHPEFSFLGRKFKVAINGAATDRTALRVHDVGIQMRLDDKGQAVTDLYVGGGLGRTPVVAPLLVAGVQAHEVLSYIEAILRVYNLHGRRDNIYKARIKILVRDLGPSEFLQQVEDQRRLQSPLPWAAAELQRITRKFELKLPVVGASDRASTLLAAHTKQSVRFALWRKTNVGPHKVAGYQAVQVSLKFMGRAPGDCTSSQMHFLADLAKRFSHSELRVTHNQNLVLPHVATNDLIELFEALKLHGLAHANIGLASDIIACPGGDFCSLANARSLPLAQDLMKLAGSPSLEQNLGPLAINISGCINSCGHHHVADIGLLGVDKHDQEFFQITVGGNPDRDQAAIGKILGKALPPAQAVQAVNRLLQGYLAQRLSTKETFAQFARRVDTEALRVLAYPAGELQAQEALV